MVPVQLILNIIFFSLMVFLWPKKDFTFHIPLTYGPIGYSKPNQLRINLLWKVSVFYFLSMLIDYFEHNFLRPQIVVGMFTPATHYPILPDLLLLILLSLQLTYIFVDSLKFANCFQSLSTSSKFISGFMCIIKVYAIDFGEWHYVQNVGISNFTRLNILK